MRRIALFIFLGCAGIALILWLNHILTTGHITITSSDPNSTITITQVVDENEGGGKVFSKQAKGGLSLTLPVGSYIATAQGNSIAATQTINLKAFQNLHYNLSPISTTGVEPVLYKGASSIAASSSRLYYIDGADGGLYQVDSQNAITRIDQTQRFTSIQWANASYGVGQGANGKLYSITNGSVSALSTPAPTTSDKTIRYAVAPNKEVFVGVGNVVYCSGPGSSFKKIYIDKESFTSLIAANGKVAVVNAPGDGSINAPAPYTVVVDDSGKSFKKTVAIEGAAVWSPDGKKMVSIKDPAAGFDILDSSLKVVASIPGNATNGLAWIDNDNLAYGDQGLWTYSVKSGRANLIANMPLAAGVSSVALSSNGAYLYVTTTDNDNNAAVRRVGLRGQNVPKYVYNLQNILPITTNEYTLSLVNFTHPTVIVQSYPGSPPTYLQDASTDLQQRGFNLSQIGVQPGASVNLNE